MGLELFNMIMPHIYVHFDSQSYPIEIIISTKNLKPANPCTWHYSKCLYILP